MHTMAFLAFYKQRRVVSNLQNNTKCKCCQDKLHEHYKRIFGLCNYLLGCNKDLVLAQSNSEQELADWFNKFFTNKIEIKTKQHSLQGKHHQQRNLTSP